MNIKSDLRTIKSKAMIKNSFLQLIKEKGYESITVKDISEKAFVNRKTFYFHYNSKKALYDEVVNETISILETNIMFDKINKLNIFCDMEKFSLYAQKVLDNIKQNKEIFKILIYDTSSGEFINKLENMLANNVDEQISILQKTSKKSIEIPIELLKCVYNSIFISIIKWWINQDDSISSKEAMKIMFLLFSDELLKVFLPSDCTKNYEKCKHTTYK